MDADFEVNYWAAKLCGFYCRMPGIEIFREFTSMGEMALNAARVPRLENRNKYKQQNHVWFVKLETFQCKVPKEERERERERELSLIHI